MNTAAKGISHNNDDDDHHHYHEPG